VIEVTKNDYDSDDVGVFMIEKLWLIRLRVCPNFISISTVPGCVLSYEYSSNTIDHLGQARALTLIVPSSRGLVVDLCPHLLIYFLLPNQIAELLLTHV
jgi:hypothetical protein